jgi:hypothetical protein
LTRSTRDLLNVLGAVADKGAGFKSLRDTWADTTTPQRQLTPIARRSRPASLSQCRLPPVVGRHIAAAALRSALGSCCQFGLGLKLDLYLIQLFSAPAGVAIKDGWVP